MAWDCQCLFIYPEAVAVCFCEMVTAEGIAAEPSEHAQVKEESATDTTASEKPAEDAGFHCYASEGSSFKINGSCESIGCTAPTGEGAEGTTPSLVTAVKE
ncbi:Protein of unknown function [Pyronema omphalodes CBS 100304]|uniref:Uncharacterized protein n=1 Tax=Pyronema omphalodes (strain CBS 100304) TaxID=1076935 RepID=U4L1Y2_PYROM|nr:Protein of unknown function [Pyronema omphalodes CBS 100304]